MSGPTTQAGKALLDSMRSGVAGFFAMELGDETDAIIPRAIAGVEREAAAAERERLRAAHVPTHPEVPVGVSWFCSTCILLVDPALEQGDE